MRIIILALVLCLALAYREKVEHLNQRVQNPERQHNFQQKELLFPQILDHYDYKTKQTFQQRYFVIDNYYNPKIGPVFIYICGQYTCSGVPEARQWVVTMAERLQGLVITLEHRFYGKSLPFGLDSYKLQNLRLLNSEQALKDLAYFTSQVVSQKLHKVDKSPWICIGGSYPGALSAWYRYKYPHLTIGGIASSAVINAIVDFKQFDEQMFLSANKSGDYCYKAINESSQRAQAILNSPEADSFKQQFQGADKLTKAEFLFFWVDSIVGQIQYGKRTKLCDSLKSKSSDAQFQVLKTIVKGNDVHEYGAYYLKNGTYYAQKLSSARAWLFQCCTEYGWWQTVSDVHALRSKLVNVQSYKQLCLDSFGVPLWPDADRKNNQYGGLEIKATNLLMTNGDQDPWKWASLLTSKDKIISRVANCTNCAHCVDLYTPSINDAPELKKIRDEQYLTISSWIEEYWRGIRSINKLGRLIKKSMLTLDQ